MATSPAADTKRRKRQEREDRARLRVLDAAESEFAASGYEDARMHAIADRAEVALGTLYSLFAGKYELFEAIHARRLGELFVEVASSLASGATATDSVRVGIRSLVTFFSARPDYLAMHLRDGQAWSSIVNLRTEVQRDAWSRGFAMMRELFAAAQREGAVVPGDPETFSRLAITMHQVFMARWLEQSPRPSADALFEDIWQTIGRTFLVRPAESTEARP